MRKLTLFLVILLLVVIAGGIAVLAFWELPPPVTTMEKTIPNDRLQP
jgi:hypothetical protein